MITFEKEKYTNTQIFKTLNPLIAKWFKQKFRVFTEPQQYAIPLIHYNQNVLVSAPTGTGKTLSAFTSILNELITLSEYEQLENKVYCVYISPLRALSRDIERNLLEPLKEIQHIASNNGKKIKVNVAVRTGDTTTAERAKMLKTVPNILITTPESIAILLNSPKFKEKLKNVRWVIVDEVHSLAENKRGVHLSLSLERLQKLAPGLCRIGLSATISPIEEVARFLVGLENKKERPCKVVDLKFLKKLDLKVVSPVKDLVNASQEELSEKMYHMIDELVQNHRTTLIFTNTRSGTERVVNHLKEKFPEKYTANIGAHHSSLSRELRLNLENRLKEGKIKVVVCSTSLELGIDIGYIDLVVLLGSPKSIARGLQRIGRSGHKLHDTVKGRIIVLDRDDLVECSVLAKHALEGKLDNIEIPENCLDVLAQQIYGVAIDAPTRVEDLYKLVRQSYCYKGLNKNDFFSVLDYLSGEYARLETRHVYAKIWHDKEEGVIGKRGKLARVLYMTNIGTIPDEAKIRVKIGDQLIGTIDEGFLERLSKGDVFVLGGQKYVFRFSRGMTAQVQAAEKRPPTVPSWFSEMLPLSFGLGNEIQKFRGLAEGYFKSGKKKKEVTDFISDYLHVEKHTAEAIYNYFSYQHEYSEMPTEKKLLVERFKEDGKRYCVVHSLYGRRVNDALSRALGYIVSKLTHRDVELTITDNGFYLASNRPIPLEQAINALLNSDLEEVLRRAIDDTEVFRRRFRHCATRALMILRSYQGRKKSVGRQQMASRLLINTVKEIDPDFSVLKEARREVMQDLMDLGNANLVLSQLRDKKMKIRYKDLEYPSPFSLKLVAEGYADIIRIEDRINFIKRMHGEIERQIESKA